MKANSLAVFLLALGFCFAGALSSCSSDEPEQFRQPTSPTIELSRSEWDVNCNINDFGMRLFSVVSSTPGITDGYPNFAISPVSMAFALAMSANIGDEDLQSDVLSAFDCESIDELNAVCRKLMMYLPDPSNKCDISLANALWCDKGLSLTASSRAAITGDFFGKISTLDFSDPFSASEAINKWAARSTNNVIDHVLDPQNLIGTKVLLANALYFKGEWETKFSKSNTVNRVFHGVKSDRDADFMRIKDTRPYVACDRYQATLLGYKGPYSMIVVLPTEGVSIDDLCASYDSSDLARFSGEMPCYMVDLSLPKFESEIQAPLGAVLKRLGIDLSAARLSGIVGADEDAKLTLGHTAKVSTDEDGTVAAAVSAGLWGGASGGPDVQGEVTLDFNRPFIYFIRNYMTRSIIMAGRVTQ